MKNRLIVFVSITFVFALGVYLRISDFYFEGKGIIGIIAMGTGMLITLALAAGYFDSWFISPPKQPKFKTKRTSFHFFEQLVEGNMAGQYIPIIPPKMSDRERTLFKIEYQAVSCIGRGIAPFSMWSNRP